jgi:hypothetical protein
VTVIKHFVVPESGTTHRRSTRLRLIGPASGLVILSLFAPLSIGPSSATDGDPSTVAQPIIELGAAGSFSALASGSLTAPAGTAAGATGTSNGDLAMQAQQDLATAFNNIALLTPTAIIAGDLGGRIFTPGIYHSDAALAMTTSVTFDALGDPNAVFIFQVGAAVNTTAGSQMILVNGAQASRIYWQTAAAVTTGASSYFIGTILGNAAITAGAGTIIQGRALTMGGAVTLDSTELLPVPDLSMTSSVDPSVDVEAGDQVVFTNVIRNRGNVSLALSLATGLPEGAATTFAWPDSGRVLPAGQSITATTTYVPTLADAVRGAVASRSTVTGTPTDFGAVSAASAVTLIVHPTPVVDSITTATGAPVSFNVLTNDAGAELDGTFSRATLGTKRRLVGGATGPVPSSPANGSVTCVDAGVDRGLCTYKPAGFFVGDDTFDYTLSQDTRSWNVRVSVSVTPTLAPPTARADRVVAVSGGPPITFDPTANDTGAGVIPLSITSSTNLPASQGHLACSDEACVFTPPTSEFTGTTHADYTVAEASPSDGRISPSSSSSITIFVDMAPFAPKGFVASVSTQVALSAGTNSGSTVVTVAAATCTDSRVSTTISWQPASRVTSWHLERRLANSTPGPWIALADLPTATTSYVDAQLGEGNAYQWQVRPDIDRWRGSFSPPSQISNQPPAVNAAGC